MKKKFTVIEWTNICNELNRFIQEDLFKNLDFGLQMADLSIKIENKFSPFSKIHTTKQVKLLEDKKGKTREEVLKLKEKFNSEINEISQKEIEIEYQDISRKDIAFNVRVYKALFKLLKKLDDNK